MMNRKMVYVFIFGGLLIFGALTLMSGFRQGWFSPSVMYSIHFETGDGVLVGTPVLVSGLKAGVVKSVELNQDNKVVVQIQVQSKFSHTIREDSKAVLGRTFIIGERSISIKPGGRNSKMLPENAVLPGEESLEITDMLSGGRLSPYFQTFTKLLDQLRVVIEGDGGVDSVNLIQLYKQAYVSLKSLEAVSRDIGAIRHDFASAPETRLLMKNLSVSSAQIGPMLEQTQKALPALTQLSAQVVTVMPELSKTLNETVFTLQALQRSFILSGGVKSLKAEMHEKEAAKSERSPASVEKTH